MDRERTPTPGRAALGALASLGAALMLAPAAASAATIAPSAGFFADDFTNNANCSLREAIEVANDDAEGGPEDSCIVVGALGDDSVILPPGAYVLDIVAPGEPDSPNPTNASDDLDVNTAGGSLTIEGAGAAQTVIYTDRPPTSWSDRVLEKGGAHPLTVRNLTVTGGGFPGAVLLGGGIYAREGALAIEGSRVTENEAAEFGGGIFGGYPLTIKDSLIDNNAAGVGAPTFSDPAGGGIATFGSSTRISSSVIRENTVFAGGGGFPPIFSFGRGGGVFLGYAEAGASVSGSVIAGNEAAGHSNGAGRGGGIYIDLSQSGDAETVTLSRSTVSGNEALAGPSDAAAGVLASGDENDTVHVVNSTISGNRGLSGGGLVSGGGLHPVTANVVHSTLAGNTAAAGSALFRAGGTLNVRGSVIDTDAGTACEGTINSQGGNVVGTSPCLTGGPGNDEEGVDPQLGPLAAKGGLAGVPGFTEPILTHRPALTSPAVDHVPAADCLDELLAPLTFDQRGLLRPVDNDGDSVAECEAGSYELQPVPGESTPPPAGVTPPATTPSPTGGDRDRSCVGLRKKLKRAKKKGKKKQAKKLRRKLRRRDC